MRESTVGDENYEACGIVSSLSLFQWFFFWREIQQNHGYSIWQMHNFPLVPSSFATLLAGPKQYRPSPPPLFCSGKFDKGGVRGGLHARGRAAVKAKFSQRPRTETALPSCSMHVLFPVLSALLCVVTVCLEANHLSSLLLFELRLKSRSAGHVTVSPPSRFFTSDERKGSPLSPNQTQTDSPGSDFANLRTEKGQVDIFFLASLLSLQSYFLHAPTLHLC